MLHNISSVECQIQLMAGKTLTNLCHKTFLLVTKHHSRLRPSLTWFLNRTLFQLMWYRNKMPSQHDNTQQVRLPPATTQLSLKTLILSKRRWVIMRTISPTQVALSLKKSPKGTITINSSSCNNNYHIQLTLKIKTYLSIRANSVSQICSNICHSKCLNRNNLSRIINMREWFLLMACYRLLK